ncbi:GPI anchored serine-threonine rich family protein [Streptomyces kunmingensis]|uniref:GPI anchored serine-threonine rich family protein n=1 Tax=Streptomyces kunmingensis TaxID=68225 RepID=A0ABU6CC83_9ACTN|nr:Ser-Thr-rich GPI-anchored membrane family protein [Streptomyces kunmingensis]MEB3962319.1 GPI anchored serine-threonine rich family protein [Streptomyces kunmingensis]
MRRTGFLVFAVVPLLFGFAPAASGPAVEVTAPTAGSVHRSGGSVLVTWHNSTGREVDMWLVHGDSVRVAQLAAKVSAAPSGEKAAVLPDVAQGADYAIEIVARDGGEHGSSPSFTVGPSAQGPPAPARQTSGPGAR